MNFNMNGMNGLMNNRMNQFSMNSSQYSLSELGSSFNDNFNSTAPQANSQAKSPTRGRIVPRRYLIVESCLRLGFVRVERFIQGGRTA